MGERFEDYLDTVKYQRHLDLHLRDTRHKYGKRYYGEENELD